MKHSQPYAESLQYPLIPLPTLSGKFTEQNPFDEFVIDMILIHNVFIRALNSLWTNSQKIKPEDVHGFAGYAVTFVELLHTHHLGEETIIFPFLQTKVNMNENVEQHAQFGVGMDEFGAYMKEVQKNPKLYDGEKTRSLLESFAGTVTQHLTEEIVSIQPERLSIFEEKDFVKMMDEHHNFVKSHPGLFTLFPFVFTHHDITDLPEWPPVPTPLKWFVRYISGWRHPSYWKFSPFEFNGEPKKISVN